MNSIIFFIGVALTIMILTEGKYLLVSIEEPEGKNIFAQLEITDFLAFILSVIE